MDKNNVQGANDAGATPVFYPGYQRVNDEAARKKFEAAWGVPLSPHDGMNLNVMMKAVIKGEMKGLYVMGEDIVLSEPNNRKLEEGLEKIDFLVCQEIFHNETTKFAHVVFPGACFAEKSGVFTNSDRRVQLVRKAVEPPGEARSDWKILRDFTRKVGYPTPNYQSAAEIYDEMAALAPKFSGISHEKLNKHVRGLQWPCTDAEHEGTEFLHQNGPSIGKAEFQAVTYHPSLELPCEDYPLSLSTGRTLYHYNAATQTRRDAGPVAKQGENFIEVHPEDAKAYGIRDGETIKVASRRGGIKAKVWISGRMQKGCVWIPLHFAEEAANRLTNDAGDRVTGTAEYKVCAVTLIPLSPRHEASTTQEKLVKSSS